MSSSGIQKFLSQLLSFLWSFCTHQALDVSSFPFTTTWEWLPGCSWEWLLILSSFFSCSCFCPATKEVLQEVFFQNNISTFFMGCCLLENSSTESARERKAREIVTCLTKKTLACASGQFGSFIQFLACFRHTVTVWLWGTWAVSVFH